MDREELWTVLLFPTVFGVFMSYCDAYTVFNFFKAILEHGLSTAAQRTRLSQLVDEAPGVLQASLRLWLKRQILCPEKAVLNLDCKRWLGKKSLWSMLNMMHDIEHHITNYYILLTPNHDMPEGVWHNVKLEKSCRFHTEGRTRIIPTFTGDIEINIRACGFGYHGFAGRAGIVGTTNGHLLFYQQTYVNELAVLGSYKLYDDIRSIVKIVTHPSSRIGLILDEKFFLTVIYFGDERIHIARLPVRCVEEMVTEDCLLGQISCIRRESPAARFWYYDGCTNLFTEHFVKMDRNPDGSERGIRVVFPSTDREMWRLRPPPWLDVPRSKVSVACQEGDQYERDRHFVLFGSTRCSAKSKLYHYLGFFQNGKTFDREIFLHVKDSLIFGWCLSVDRKRLYVGFLSKLGPKTEAERESGNWHACFEQDLRENGFTARAQTVFVSRKKKGHCFCVANYSHYNWVAIVEVDLSRVDFVSQHLKSQFAPATRLLHFIPAFERDELLTVAKSNVLKCFDRETLWCTERNLYFQFSTVHLTCFPLCLGLGSSAFSRGPCDDTEDVFFFRKDDTEFIKKFDSGPIIFIECPRLLGRHFRHYVQSDGMRARSHFRKRSSVHISEIDCWKENFASRKKLLH